MTTTAVIRIALLCLSLSCIDAEARKYTLEELERITASRESLKQQERDALAGDAKAQLRLGIYCQFGMQGYKRDPVAAVSWYTQAAMKKNPDALFNLGGCLEDGVGLQKNLIDAYAHYTLAKRYGRASDSKQRLEELEARMSPGDIEKGKARSQEIYYLINPGEKEADTKRQQEEILRRVERQLAAAKEEALRKEAATKEKAKQLEIIKEKAAKGDSDAELRLGSLYETGDEVLGPKDEQVAASWFLKAAMQGNAEAQYRLGLCYFTGKGTPKDLLQAYALFDIAGNHLEAARLQLSAVQNNMTDAQIIAAPKKSRELQKQISEHIAKKSSK